MKVGFIGTGAIAAPMARALARDGHAVTVSERNADVAADLAGAGLGIEIATNQAVIDASDVVFLCLRPAVWEQVLDGLAWRADHQVVSVMAGPSLGRIAEVCAPATRIAATIPYGFIELGGCPLPVIGDPTALNALFGARNPVLPQAEESALAQHFAASTLITAVLGAMETGADWLAEQTGDADKAEVYVSNLVAGVLANMQKDRAGRLAEAKWALATPDTLNLRMVEAMRDAHLTEALQAALWAIAGSMEG